MITSSVSGHAAEDTQHKYPYMVDGHILRLKFTKNIYELHLQQSSGGTIAGSPLSGVSGTVFNLTATPTGRHEFDSFSITGAALTGSAGTYINSDVTAVANFNYIPLPTYTITLQTSGNGTLTASKLTAESGETITIGATPDTYNRFDSYSVTGGIIDGNNLTVTADCTARANFYANSFTAKGTFDTGSRVEVVAYTGFETASIGDHYACLTSTAGIPREWYNGYGNRWNPKGPISGYQIYLNPKPKMINRVRNDGYHSGSAWCSVWQFVGNSAFNTVNNYDTASGTHNHTYGSPLTSNATDVYYGYRGGLSAAGEYAQIGYYGSAVYDAAASTGGSWSASGYIP